MIEGGCLCGAVRFAIDAGPEAPVACHCAECRSQSGHYWAATRVPTGALRVEGEVRWYAASDVARRGFCPGCGSVLFWDPQGEATVSVAVGSLDAPTGLALAEHIWVSEKGDYYEIADGLPQRER